MDCMYGGVLVWSGEDFWGRYIVFFSLRGVERRGSKVDERPCLRRGNGLWVVGCFTVGKIIGYAIMVSPWGREVVIDGASELCGALESLTDSLQGNICSVQ
jgi:hypothetical protein